MPIARVAAVASLLVTVAAACGETTPNGPADASKIDALEHDSGSGFPDAHIPTCSDAIQNGDEEAVDCGGTTCDPCVDCSKPEDCESGECRDGTCAVTRLEPCTDAAPSNATSTIADVMTSFTPGEGWSTPADCEWACNTDYAESAGACINQRTVSCADAAPANATSTAADVVITYTTAGGWTTPADCAWTCNADFDQDGVSCINQKSAQCTDAAPANGTSTIADVIITYTDAGGWTTPADCAWTCNADFDEAAGTCINERQVSCNDAAPANATSTVENVTITYTDAGGWTTPGDCTWSCNADYSLETGSCINQKQVACNDAAPANATSIPGSVNITYTDAGGWTTPADCAWACNVDYDQFAETCINQRQVACTDAAPANATSTIADVTITYTDAGGWTTPADCAWSCDADYDQEGDSCINQKQVACNDNPPANATSIPGVVTITYTDAGGWTSPADCSWECIVDYDLWGGACINERTVQCNDVAPANATSTITNVTITYSDAGGWTTPADCAWTCDGDYCLNGNQCDPPTYVEQKYEPAGQVGQAWFGGDDGASGPRNIGAGQRINSDHTMTMASFAFRYNLPFTSSATPGRGVAVTIQLDVYDAAGKFLTTTQTDVPSSFLGGWVWFDVAGNLTAGTDYHFASHVVNGYTQGVNSQIHAHTNNGYPAGHRINAVDSDGQTDLGTWDPWYITGGDWDHAFWIRSGPICQN